MRRSRRARSNPVSSPHRARKAISRATATLTRSKPRPRALTTCHQGTHRGSRPPRHHEVAGDLARSQASHGLRSRAGSRPEPVEGSRQRSTVRSRPHPRVHGPGNGSAALLGHAAPRRRPGTDRRRNARRAQTGDGRRDCTPGDERDPGSSAPSRPTPHLHAQTAHSADADMGRWAAPASHWKAARRPRRGRQAPRRAPRRTRPLGNRSASDSRTSARPRRRPGSASVALTISHPDHRHDPPRRRSQQTILTAPVTGRLDLTRQVLDLRDMSSPVPPVELVETAALRPASWRARPK